MNETSRSAYSQIHYLRYLVPQHEDFLDQLKLPPPDVGEEVLVFGREITLRRDDLPELDDRVVTGNRITRHRHYGHWVNARNKK